MAKWISKVNKFTSKFLGVAGRPVAVGGAAAGATYGMGRVLDNGVLSHPAMVVGTGVVAAGAAEGTMYLWGRDPEVQAESLKAEIARLFERMEKAEDKAASEKLVSEFIGGLPEAVKAAAREAIVAQATSSKKAAANG